MTEIKIPEFCLILLVGASGSGKSSFASHHFLPTEILSSDALRGWVSDDETSMDATQDAFEVLRFIAQKRLARMKLTVIDATNVQPEARKQLLELAQEYHAKPIALVFDMPESLCLQRNQSRTDRTLPNYVIKRQKQQLRRSINGLEHEGFRGVHIFKTPEQVAEITITREKLYPNMKHETGPFDIIGDIHGCYDELVLLLEKLGYQVNSETHQALPPNQRRAIFVGDLVDRGAKSSDVLKLVMNMVNSGHAFCVVGNHDDKLLRALRGKKVNIGHGLEQTLAQLATEPTEFIEQIKTFLSGLASHYVFDGGALVVAHGGIREDMIGRVSGAIRSFTLYGDTTGERDDYGLPVRRDWAVNYRGSSMIIYGHTPIARPQWVNNTLNIDTGCVFGGNLTALQYPEKVWVSVESLHQYAVPARPFMLDKPDLTLQHQVDDHLAIHDVLVLDDPMGKRHIETRLDGAVLIRNRNATAALEVMSRFAVNPKWLIYLPPTMSPVQTSTLPNLLEHPDQAFGYYRDMGVEQVVCQEKHMGSRAIVVICKDEKVAQARFGVINEGRGVIYTRTGRRFFEDVTLEIGLLNHLDARISQAGLWDELQTDWMILDCELMPWSAKAQELLHDQYAAVGTSAQHGIASVIENLQSASGRYPEIAPMLEKYQHRAGHITQFISAYGRYCWDIHDIHDLRLAPFHLLATEGTVHIDKTHLWHMETLAKLQQDGDKRIYPTAYRMVDVNDDASVQAGIRWWETLTENGGEGMVVKPLEFVMMGRRGIIQPALKVRGREYLRIIYGAEYTDHLDLLRERAIGHKRNLALREFALGIEALVRFIEEEPLRRVHECVFGILALESEPIDPRL